MIRIRYRWVLCLVMLLVLMEKSGGFAGQLSDQRALQTYLDGLDALVQARWPKAITAFTRSLQTHSDPEVVLARGVAYTLAEQFPQALEDFQRAQRLGLKGREAKLWTYVVGTMSGQGTPGTAIPVPKSLQGQYPPPAISPGIPGHMIQGGTDYPTDYASFIYYEMASPYGEARAAGADTHTPSLRQAMITAGRWFAHRAMARPDLAPVHLERAKQLHAARQYEAALTELKYARAAYPDHPEVIYYIADSWLALGRPITARREFTIALTLRTNFADAYAGRAMAAAKLGDARRARIDLDIASRFDAVAAKRARITVETELIKQRVNGPLSEHLSALDRAAASGAPVEQLIPLAIQIHKAAGAQRLRYDEIYQERLRQLEEALRASPGQVDPYVNLAAYLIAEADNRGEKVEPGRALMLYRWQKSREHELRWAIDILDEALGLNPKHVRALIQKAFALTALQEYDQAEKLVEQALTLAGDNPDALRLYARFRAMRANQVAAEAWALRQERCSSSTTTEHRSDGVYEITQTTCYQPTQADLQRAAYLDRLAGELRRKALAAMQTAIKLTLGTVEGFLLQADLEIWAGQLERAQAFLEEAVKLDPQSLEAQERLVDFYVRTGQSDRAEEQEAIARQLIHTTAAPLLRLAWNRVTKTAWPEARAYLMRARQLDPEDARVLAYLGVVLTAEGKPEEATAAFRTALALEEARLQLDEPSAQGTLLTRDALDFGLLMQIRHLLAAPLMKAGYYAEALELYRANTAYASRFAPGGRATQMFSAMLPDPHAPPASVPKPVNGATLLAEAFLNAGKALKALGRKEEALEEFKRAAAFVRPLGSMIPNIGNVRGDTNFAGEAGAPAAEALLELAKNFRDLGDYDTALQYAQAATQHSPPAHLRRELNELNLEIVNKLNAKLAEQQSRQYQQQQEETARLWQQQIKQQQEWEQLRRSGAPVDPDLVGIWETSAADYPPPPTPFILAIEADGSYTITTGSGPTASLTRGRMQAWGSHMTLVDEQGKTTRAAFRIMGSQFYGAAQGKDLLQITFFQGASYRLHRRP